MKKSISSHKKSLPHISQGIFYNYPGEKHSAVLIPSVYMYIRSLLSRIFHASYNRNDWTVKQAPQQQSSDPIITWIGHATFLVQIGGLNILTDPLFRNPSLLYSRMLPLGLTLAQMPPLDAVLLSHNHPDHMSSACLADIERLHRPQMLVGQNLGAWFRKRKFSQVEELMWWEKFSIPAKDGSGDAVDFWFLPCKHWSQRGLFDRNKTLWGSWMIVYKGYKIYFAGNTAYGEHFTHIGEEFGPINVSLLPIGPGEPHELLKHSHIDARQAMQAFIDLKAEICIPMHWGTFGFGTEHFSRPIDYLRELWLAQNEQLESKVLRVAKVGEPIPYRLDPISQSGIPKAVAPDHTMNSM